MMMRKQSSILTLAILGTLAMLAGVGLLLVGAARSEAQAPGNAALAAPQGAVTATPTAGGCGTLPAWQPGPPRLPAREYIQGATGSDEERRRVLRLVETMTIGATAVAFRTESMHGAGSPQAQRIQIARQMELDYKKRLARRLAGVGEEEPTPEEGGYFERVFEPET